LSIVVKRPVLTLFRSKRVPCLLNLFSHEYFADFFKNVESPFTILWNCLHERCFILHTSFRRETGSTWMVSLSFMVCSCINEKIVPY